MRDAVAGPIPFRVDKDITEPLRLQSSWYSAKARVVVDLTVPSGLEVTCFSRLGLNVPCFLVLRQDGLALARNEVRIQLPVNQLGYLIGSEHDAVWFLPSFQIL